MRRVLLVCLVLVTSLACDQVTKVYVSQVAPSEVQTVVVEVHGKVHAHPAPSKDPTSPAPDPCAGKAGDEFKVRDHVQWVNACGSPDEKAGPPPVEPPKPPAPPLCKNCTPGKR